MGIDIEIHDRGRADFLTISEIRSVPPARILSGFFPKGAVPVTRKSSQMFARDSRRTLASHMRLYCKWIKSTLRIQSAPFAFALNKDLLHYPRDPGTPRSLDNESRWRKTTLIFSDW